ncbi:MAG: chromosome condensation regulator [Hyperionvirus sp.]|uniref:Chromosome condensation regulator n=1 Tax=Hyperionvirus sp. TaxID=2487770 RepID=A0A3G5AEP3_9VIRU|nr:MAG: chromosome condensation regulator [Hyperionvirus sp.]
MDLLKNFPIDLLYIILNYDPESFFLNISKSELLKYDWARLIKMSFSLTYQRESCTNKQMMNVYKHNYYRTKSKIICGLTYTFILGDEKLTQFGDLRTIRPKFCERATEKLKNMTEVICGHSYAIVVLADGTLLSYGNNDSGQLGVRDNLNRNFFERITGIPKNIAEVVCSEESTIIRLTNGTLLACGNNYYGQLGLGDNLNRYAFEEIKGIPKNIVEVICNEFDTIIRLTDGTLMRCGNNENGYLGFGDSRDRFSFEGISGIPKNIVKVICSARTTIIMLTDGTLMGCGANMFGELGLGYNRDVTLFEEITGIPKNIKEVICGLWHTIIRFANGRLMSSGYNRFGQLGLGDTVNRNIFQEIKGIPKDIVAVKNINHHTIVVLGDGRLMGCGFNNFGFLGFGDNRSRNSFEEIKGIPTNIAEVICGKLHTVIRLTNGTMMSCGYNYGGQLGLRDNLNRYRFEEISLKGDLKE